MKPFPCPLSLHALCFRRLSRPLATRGPALSLALGQNCPVSGQNDVAPKGVTHCFAAGNCTRCVPCRGFHSSTKFNVEQRLKTGVRECYALLGVEEDCEDQELKSAYLEKAKAYHPDASSPLADANKFSQVKEAYKAALEHRRGRALKEEEEEEVEVIFDIKHTAPQHRQYLEFEGVGCGTPSQRQRQYQQHRVARVTENVFQHRMQRLAAQTEDALVLRDKQEARKAKISNAVERMVEDLIQESMQRGDFNDLPGQGQPLAHKEHNPFVDATTHNLNKILVNNGFAPEWIMLQGEIRADLHHARQTLAIVHDRLGPRPLSKQNSDDWSEALSCFSRQVNEVNFKIHKFNLIVPFLDKQKIPYCVDRETGRVVNHVQSYLPEQPLVSHHVWDASKNPGFSASVSGDPISWRQVWLDIKSVFKTSDDDKYEQDRL